jgi:hypothetical protein
LLLALFIPDPEDGTNALLLNVGKQLTARRHIYNFYLFVNLVVSTHVVLNGKGTFAPGLN